MNTRNFAKWAACLALAGLGGSAYGLPILIDWQDGPQDPMFLPQNVHELGVLFPPDEEIMTIDLGPTTQTACFDGSDNPGLANQMVQMTNLSPHTYYNVHYVKDPDTLFTNFDGWVNGMEAFRIDNVGINRPLLNEFGGIPGDNIFQPNETWEFIIQDYFNILGGPPSALDSFGVPSPGWPPSTGSIIAEIPEPATLGLMLLGLGGLVSRRRR